MSYFLNFRSAAVGGAVVDPYLLEGDGRTDPPALAVVPWAQLPAVFSGRNVLLATHGFNVSYAGGAGSLGWLDQYFSLAPTDLFVGMLWPGDSWLPVVDYPFEGSVAIDCGRRLADFCNRWCTGAQSISFLSHSLGARMVLEAVAHLGRQARAVCLMAGAINRDCLTAEYAQATANAAAISVLASHNDLVLRLAFTVGDPFANLLDPDHAPFRAALGYDGPPTPTPVLAPWQIPNAADYGHGDYLPPSDLAALPAPPPPYQDRWQRAADFMKRAFLGQPLFWPP